MYDEKGSSDANYHSCDTMLEVTEFCISFCIARSTLITVIHILVCSYQLAYFA